MSLLGGLTPMTEMQPAKGVSNRGAGARMEPIFTSYRALRLFESPDAYQRAVRSISSRLQQRGPRHGKHRLGAARDTDHASG